MKRTLSYSYRQRNSIDSRFPFLCICEISRQLPGQDPDQVRPHRGRDLLRRGSPRQPLLQERRAPQQDRVQAIVSDPS